MSWKPNNVLIIGCGGIGSFFIQHLNRLMLNDQIPMSIEFNLVDFDRVELKNISYQNFEETDVLKKKSEVLGDRYGFYAEDKQIKSAADLKGFDAIILCVDNSSVRKLVYEYCYTNNIFFIDMRAEGREIAIITQELDKDKALATLPKVVNTKGGSCQKSYEFENGIIQYGNVVVASMGAQIFLNKLRGEKYNPQMIMRV